jgi:hypothetical protein
MKIQLDTIKKTITIEEDVNLHDFYEQLNSLLPGGLWREFTLKITKITEWKEPITVTPTTPIDPWRPLTTPSIPSPYDNPFPPTYPHVWYTTSTNNDLTLNPGIYNFLTN